ncbi:MAG: hypothetical protein PHO56_04955 [Patescibacteria group bacterium]|nr:hypothetical protein [Patescibacteria group bacterium]
MFKNKQKIILLSAFFAGLAARIFLLFTQTTADMGSYLDWGNRVLNQGLAFGFQGTYFPLQWQIFAFCSLIGKITHLDFQLILKTLTLLFDAGNFVLVIAILKKLKGNPLYSLLYWLHPWFLIVFSLGYVDFQLTFFILLAIYLLLKGQKFSDYLWAGLPLGLALLMKPQTQIVILAVIVYALFDFIKNRKLKRFALLIFPAALFLGYEIYFFLARLPVKGFLRALIILPYYYLTIQNVKPQLTAQMLNFWYPVVYFIREPGAPFYASSNIYLLPFVKAKILASLATVFLVSSYAWLVNKKNERPDSGSAYLLIFAFATTLVPFLMTSAHENHLFLATVLLIPLAAKFGGKILNLSFQGLLVIQFINIYLIYAYDRIGLALQKYYTYGFRTILAGVSIILFVLVLRELVKINRIQNYAGEDNPVVEQDQ